MDNSEYYRQNADGGASRRTPAFCGKCGSKAPEGATRCAYCGAYLIGPDSEKTMRVTPLSDPGAQQPVAWNPDVAYSDPAPQQAAWAQTPAPVSAQPQPWNGSYSDTYDRTRIKETSVGAWFAWTLLLVFVPVVGTIIMVASTRPGSTKNFAKLLLIFQIIAIVILLIVVIFFSSVLVALFDELKDMVYMPFLFG